MARDFNIEPYFDDFDETKNFHRVLYKPGYAVQARELTQSQTILQDQISKFGLGVYADGSKVSGGNITVDNTIITCKLISDDNISNFVDYYAVGETSKLIIEVVSVDQSNYYLLGKTVNASNGGKFSSGEVINFYDSKLKAFSSLNSVIVPSYSSTAKTETTESKTISGTYQEDKIAINTSRMSVGDTLTVSSSNTVYTITNINSLNELVVDKLLITDYSNESVTVTNNISLQSLQVNIDEGVWFTNGLFVRNDSVSIIPDGLSIYPSVVVGFEVNETIIDHFDDASLLDPAIGASNYQAPGSDRYRVTLNLVTKPYLSDQVVADLTNNKFIELIRINKGVIEDKNDTPIFTEINKRIAQSVYDQSGDFVVNPYSLRIANLNSSSNLINATVSSGKVYVNGNPVEHIAPTNITLEKARDTTSDTNQNISTYYGNYTTIRDMSGSVLNFQTGSKVELHNVSVPTANSSTLIGSARVRNFLYDDGSASNITYKAFLYDIKLDNNEFANVNSFIVTENENDYSVLSFSANTVSNSKIIDSNYDGLLFKLPQVNIENISNINYISTRRYETPSFSNGVCSINTTGSNEDFVGGSGILSSAQAKLNYILVVSTTSGDYTKGQFIPMDGDSITVSVTNSSIGPSQATFDIGGGFSGTATIYATISITSDNLKNKTLVSKEVVKVSTATTNIPIDLGKSDIYKFSGLYELAENQIYIGLWNSGVNYKIDDCVSYEGVAYVSLIDNNAGNIPNTSSDWIALDNSINSGDFSFDNGQKDAYYDHGSITNISGLPKNEAIIVFDYFTHSGGQGFFTLNSYVDIDYVNIPDFVSSTYGAKYSLRDVIDFRPRRTDGIGSTTFDTFQLVRPLENVFVDYSYYLSRIDKIALHTNGQFKTIRGISSYLSPVEPSDISNALTIFTIKYSAYTFNNNDILVKPTNLRRYTMKDIGLLEKRINNIEYYASLSLLESQVAGKDVLNADGQNILFKNGYLVDNFKGQDVGDVQNLDFSSSIDFTEQLARPTFKSRTTDFTNDTNQNSFIPSLSKQNNKLSVKNNIVTFSYTESTLVSQNVATQITNVNPFNVFNWIGNIKLNPTSDVWHDTQFQPIINEVNEDQGAWIAAINGSGFGLQWNDWQINWSGQNVVTATNNQGQIARDTQAIQNALTAKGLTSTLTSGNILVTSSNKMISSSIIPYARSININFELFGMPPYQNLHAFIGRACADIFVKPKTSSTESVYKIDIVNSGSGYIDGNNQYIISVIGANTSPCVATANVVGGKIVNVNILNAGAGYLSTPSIAVIGGNTSTALLTANTTSYVNTTLRTDGNGYAAGIITIPNNADFKVPTGQILVEFSDTPFEPALGSAYAKTVFHSSGTLDTIQTTLVSTRTPISTPKPVVTTPTTPTIPPSPVFDPKVNPLPFLFADVNDAEINTTVTSTTIPIYGLEPNYSIVVSASNGTIDVGTSSLSGTFASSKTVTTSATGSLVVAARLTTGFQYATPQKVKVSIGEQQASFLVTTRIADIVPNNFVFSPRNDATVNTDYTSDTVTITGLDPNISVYVSATNGTIDAGTSSLSGTFATTKTVTTSITGTIVVAAKGTSSSSYSTPKKVSVLVGSISSEYVITTLAPTTNPNTFVFNPRTNAAINTEYTSDTTTITGLSPGITVTVTASGGTVDAGTSTLSNAFSTSKTVTTSASGTLVVAARRYSSSSYSTGVSVTVTVGNISGVYGITTTALSQPNTFSFTNVTNADLSTIYTSDTVTISGFSPSVSVTVTASNGTIDAGTSSLSGTFASSKTVTSSASGTIVVAARGTSSASYSNTISVTVSVSNISSQFSITSKQAIIPPNVFNFNPVVNATTNTEYTSDTVTISGFSPGISVSISASGGTIDAGTSSLSGTFASSKTVTSSATGTIVVAARGTSSASASTTVNVSVNINGTVGVFSITTAIVDNSPDPFSFTNLTNAELSTAYTSNTITLIGMSPSTSITITCTGGTIDAGTSALSGTFASSKTVTTSGSGTLVLAARGTSSASYSTSISVNVSINGVSGQYIVITKQATTDPTAITFTNVIGAEISTQYTSDTVTISGFSPGISVIVSCSSLWGAAFDAGTSVLSGTFGNTQRTITSSPSGTIVVAARGTSRTGYSSTAAIVITVNGTTGLFNITTKAEDTIPEPFSFTDVSEASLSTVYTSEIITVSGVSPGSVLSISATGGTVDAATSSAQLDGVYDSTTTAVASASGTIALRARITSSASASTSVNVKVNINGVIGTYTVVTAGADTTPNDFTFAKYTGQNPNTTYTSNAVTVSGFSPNISVTVNASGISGLVKVGTDSLSGSFATSRTVTTSASGTIVVQAQATTPNGPGLAVTTTVTINGISGIFMVVTADAAGQDTAPNPFNFGSALVDKTTGMITVISDTITVSGLGKNELINVQSGSEEALIDAGTTSLSGTYAKSKNIRTSSGGTLVANMHVLLDPSKVAYNGTYTFYAHVMASTGKFTVTIKPSVTTTTATPFSPDALTGNPSITINSGLQDAQIAAEYFWLTQ